MKVIKCGVFIEDDGSKSEIYSSPETGETVIFSSSVNPRFVTNMMVDEPFDYGEKFYEGQFKQYENSRGIISTPTNVIVLYEEQASFYALFSNESFRDVHYTLEPVNETYEISKEN